MAEAASPPESEAAAPVLEDAPVERAPRPGEAPASDDARQRDDGPEQHDAAARDDREELAGTRGAAADLPTLLEAMLFVSDGPLPERTLARVLDVTPRRVGAALEQLGESLAGRGVRLQRGPDGAQLVTAPQAAGAVEELLGLESGRRLSAAAMETLAIVAYRQPVTRGQIERIRGVSSDAGIATLRARELIAEVGRAPGPGRPTLFGTTQRFLEHFGLEHPRQLPPLPPEIAPLAAAASQLALADAAASSGAPATETPSELETPPAAEAPAPRFEESRPPADADEKPPDSAFADGWAPPAADPGVLPGG